MGLFDDLIPQKMTAEPPTFIDRPSVQPSKRVWGDAEAEQAGLYETKQPQSQRATQVAAALSFDDLIPQESRAPVRITVNPVADRFPTQPIPGSDNTKLQTALQDRTLEMTRGERLQPAAQMAGGLANLVPAASQGTSPHVENYGGKVVSTDVFEDDGGNILFRDPQTGQVQPTDNSKHVAIRDPADGVVKVFERSEATNEGPVTGMSRVLGAGMMAGAPTARAAIGTASKIVPTASDTFSTAKPFYRAFDAEARGINVAPEAAEGYVSRIKQAMRDAKVPQHLADEVYKSVDEIATGGAVTAEHLRSVKELIGQSSRSIDSRVRQAAGVANKEINKIIGELSRPAAENLKTADEIYSTAKSMQDLQRKGAVADLRAGRAGYGGNAVNSMRQVLSPIVQRSIEGKPTGLKPNEIEAVREIVEGNVMTNALRGIGQLSPSKGIIQTVGAGGAMYAAGPAALAIPAIGAASNKLATILTGKQIDRLTELVAKRSPEYAKAVQKAVERFERAQMELINDPSPNRFAAYISASRALSSGLQRDGISITSGDLLKSLTGPMKTAAEEDQGPVQGPSGQQ